VQEKFSVKSAQRRWNNIQIFFSKNLEIMIELVSTVDRNRLFLRVRGVTSDATFRLQFGPEDAPFPPQRPLPLGRHVPVFSRHVSGADQSDACIRQNCLQGFVSGPAYCHAGAVVLFLHQLLPGLNSGSVASSGLYLFLRTQPHLCLQSKTFEAANQTFELIRD